jgi:hypothetical protein
MADLVVAFVLDLVDGGLAAFCDCLRDGLVWLHRVGARLMGGE